MKKMIACLTLLISLFASAQGKKKLLIYVQGGHMSDSYIKELRQEHIISTRETHRHKCIILNAGIQVPVGSAWRVGPAFTYDHFGTKHRSVEFSNISYMVRCDRVWRKTKKYLLYSGASIGIKKIRKFVDEVETERGTTVAYQVWLAGAEWRMKNVMVDINTGYGVAGLLNAGMKYRF